MHPGGMSVKPAIQWMLLAFLIWPADPVDAHPIRHRFLLARTSKKLKGQVLDYTRNTGKDCRMWSPALGKSRDLYVYLPPGYDPHKKYPLIILLHGFAQDETAFLYYLAEPIDKAICKGEFPPVIVAAPDGTLEGRSCFLDGGTFYANVPAGRYCDYLMKDVWNFVHKRFPIRSEREAHALVGASMGGGAAYSNGFLYRDRVKHLAGIFPPLNTRYISCRDKYMDDFDPCCWKYREDYSRGREIVGRFFNVFILRLGQITRPLYGDAKDVAQQASRTNPIEMLTRLNIKPGEFNMFVAYGGRDEFNLDAQIDSFLFMAKHLGLEVTVRYDPEGRHNSATAEKFIPDTLDWLAQQLWPYAPE